MFRRAHILRFVLAGLFCQALWACEQASTNPRVSSQAAAAPHEFVLRGITAQRFVNDNLLYRATASQATIDRRSGDIQASDVQILGRTSSVSAQVVTGNFDQDALQFRGNVRVRDMLGRVIRTKAATFYSRDNRLVTTSSVSLEGANFTAKGRSLEADFRTQEIHIKGPVRGTFTDR